MAFTQTRGRQESHSGNYLRYYYYTHLFTRRTVNTNAQLTQCSQPAAQPLPWASACIRGEAMKAAQRLGLLGEQAARGTLPCGGLCCHCRCLLPGASVEEGCWLLRRVQLQTHRDDGRPCSITGLTCCICAVCTQVSL